ncbi:MAG: hypothetical protein IJ604_08890 [Prevotella sp.]|nr:hypothetical protein [Prevotella sp.]
MAQEITNFARFYGVFNKIKCPGDREELKSDLVRQVTGGRTDSLREVTKQEYQDLCASLERTFPDAAVHNAIVAELKRQRSIALHQMQKMGVDTTDWNRINTLCKDPRIAGKMFGQMTAEELADMTIRLRSIERKGGFRHLDEPTAKIINIY